MWWRFRVQSIRVSTVSIVELMKIIYVIGSLEVGGAEQHLFRVASAIRAQGYEPEVFALTPGGPLTPAFVRSGIPVHGVQVPGWLRRLLRHERAVAWVGLFLSAAALWSLYWRRRADIVHFFLPSAYIVGGIVALLGPRMLRVMSRRSLNHYQVKHRLFTRLEYRLHPWMDLVCGNSCAVVRQLQEEGVPPQRLRLIYNGIDVQQYRPQRARTDTRCDLGLSETCLVFVMVANLIGYKGHTDLIQALAAVADRLPGDWVCLCAGRDDGIGGALQKQADESGIGGHIRFLGSRRDVPDLLGAADIGVLCSHQEGFSNAVIEGMACGLPMIVTDVGGNAEAVMHGHNGYVVPAKNPIALAEALLALAADSAARQHMGQAGRHRVQEMFSMDACIDRYIKLYNRRLEPESGSPIIPGAMSESR